MNPLADNYDPAANTDDGSCVIYGCIDKDAANWYVDIYGAIPQGVELVDDGSCIYVSNNPDAGCTDPAATNWDSAATVDDGSCVYGPGPVDDDGGSPPGAAPPPDGGDDGGEPSPRLGNPDDNEESISAITPRRTGGTTY
jgi:hypothetical protein